LSAKSNILNAAAAGINASKLLPRQNEAESPLEISFMRAPFASEEVRDEFIDALGPYLPVHGVGLQRSISHRHELIDV
jgi:hypothetical protein